MDGTTIHIALLPQFEVMRLENLHFVYTGINFYSDVGSLFVGDHSILDKLEKQAAGDVQRCDHSYMQQKYPYLKFGHEDGGLFNFTGGVINPRAQVDAAITVASRQGCDIIRDIVCEVTKKDQSPDSVMVLKTERGGTYFAKKVILATNTFTSSRDLLPGPNVKFEASPQTVVFAEVDSKDLEQLR